jgi:hypothetical protein
VLLRVPHAYASCVAAATHRSRWQDESAGGCPPNFASWRCNPQWLLRTTQLLRLTVSISVPQPAPPADGSAAPLFTPEAAIGVSVMRGNSGADSRRRRLLLTSPEELVVRAEPRPVRRLVMEIELEPSETPYIIMPHTYVHPIASPSRPHRVPSRPIASQRVPARPSASQRVPSVPPSARLILSRSPRFSSQVHARPRVPVHAHAARRRRQRRRRRRFFV